MHKGHLTWEGEEKYLNPDLIKAQLLQEPGEVRIE